jgi:L-ascorbate metabolism protein UlaG (beta-lactamase superfamily)
MNPREGALAAQWLGLDIVLPCHYIDPEHADVREFVGHLDAARARGERAPKPIVLRPGDSITL